MTEIDITRFQPATVAPGKVNSVQAGENSGGHYGSASARQEEPDTKDEQQGEDAGQEQDSTEETEELKNAVTKLNDYVQSVQRDILFDLDEEGNEEPAVSVVDRSSRKVLRQFGSKETLELVEELETHQSLSLFKAQV